MFRSRMAIVPPTEWPTTEGLNLDTRISRTCYRRPERSRGIAGPLTIHPQQHCRPLDCQYSLRECRGGDGETRKR